MTITIDIKPDVQAELERKAAAQGVDVRVYVETLLEQEARPRAKYVRPEGRKSLAQLFAESPFAGLDMDFGRDSDRGRDIDL